jgi:hypothetical protein
MAAHSRSKLRSPSFVCNFRSKESLVLTKDHTEIAVLMETSRRWRHACTAPCAVGNLLGWQKANGRSRHRNVREAPQSNAGGVKYEGPSQQRGTKGEHGRYVAVNGTDAGYVVRELKMATTVAAALVGNEAENWRRPYAAGRASGRTSGGSIVLLITSEYQQRLLLHRDCGDPLLNRSLAFFIVPNCHLHGSPVVKRSRWPVTFAVGAFIVRVPFHLKG